MTLGRFSLFALLLASGLPAADARLLHAIKLAEDVRDPARRGPAGELGYYRLTPAAWVQHTAAPFARAATDAPLEERIAAQHLDWLERALVRAGQVPTPYRLALAWNAGLAGSSRGHAPASARDYARRVVNLWEAAP